MSCGIYYIINKTNRKRYIGFSKNIEARNNHEYKELIKGTWLCADGRETKIQRAWNKYGKDTFIFVTAEECQIELLSEREIYHCHMFPKEMLYNIANPGQGGDLGEEVNKIIAINTKTALADPDTKRRQSENTRKALADPEVKARSKEQVKLTWQNDDVRKRRSEAISEGLVGHKHSKITKEKIGKAQIGRVHSEEQNKKQSESLKAVYIKNPELKDKLKHFGTDHYAWKDIDKSELETLYNNGYTIEQLMKHFNASGSTVFRRLKKFEII